MKKIKEFTKRNLKVIIAFIIGIMVSGIVVYAETIMLNGNEISFDNSKANLTLNNQSVTNMQDAVDALYEKASKVRMEYMCPGCLFTKTVSGYTTWNTESKTATTITSSTEGITTDYTTLGNSFLGLVTNSNNQVVSAYACGLYNNDTSKPFCIQGSSDGSTYTSNLKLLQSSNYWNNECDNRSSSVACRSSVNADADSTGSVSTDVGGSNYCVAYSNGRFDCW